MRMKNKADKFEKNEASTDAYLSELNSEKNVLKLPVRVDVAD